MGMYGHLEVTDRGAVRTITLNRPEVLNACDSQTHLELQEAMREADAAPGVGAVVITGAGRAFCAGSDIRETSRLSGADAYEYIRLDYATKNVVASSRKPTVAAVHGYCLGGGAELALACDIRVLSDSAVVAFPETGLGTIPGSGGLQRLPAIVGRGVALEWVVTGVRVTAQRAFEAGFANRVVSVDALGEACHELGVLLASRDRQALHLAKVALDAFPPSDNGMIAVYHQLASAACHAGDSFRESTKTYGEDRS